MTKRKSQEGPATALYLKQIKVGPMENFIYLVGDQNAKECFMVDPAWEVERAIQVAAADGIKVMGGIATHTHYDHIDGVGELVKKTQGKIYVHKAETSFLMVPPDTIQPTEDGTRLTIGSVEIVFLHTPGHSPGSQCMLVEGHLISGDTLFVGACGRVDLVGGDAEKLYASLKRLTEEVPGETIVLPGHDYGETPTSTIAHEKKNNPYMQHDSLKDFLINRLGY